MKTTCKQCGGQTNGTKFCNERCKWTWHNHNRTLTPNVVGPCVICGNRVSRWESPARQAKETDKRIFCGRTCAGVGRMGDRHPMWNGGRVLEDGYVLIYRPSHPHANTKGYVREHRLVMEKKIGRFLEPIEVVHHKNENPSDNRIGNLKLYPNNAEHKADHARNRRRTKDGRLIANR